MRHTVIVIEDDPEVNAAIASYLDSEGFAVLRAFNGQEGLDHLEQAEPQRCVVVLDLMMPVMTGWEFMAAVRARPEFDEVPVITASAAQLPPPAGVTAHLGKPFSIDALVELIKEHAA